MCRRSDLLTKNGHSLGAKLQTACACRLPVTAAVDGSEESSPAITTAFKAVASCSTVYGLVMTPLGQVRSGNGTGTKGLYFCDGFLIMTVLALKGLRHIRRGGAWRAWGKAKREFRLCARGAQQQTGQR